jgi:hypothetical protein
MDEITTHVALLLELATPDLRQEKTTNPLGLATRFISSSPLLIMAKLK